MGRPLLILLVVLAGGCAAGPERQVLQGAGDPVELVHVPFFAQDAYQCGPAALATVLADSGVDVTPEQLVSRIYLPDRRGSLQVELLAATRSFGRVPYLLPGRLQPLLDEVNAGRPVLLLQNLRVDRWPAWHYAVLVGFDPDNETFLLRSGTERRAQLRARRFLDTWDRGDRWALVAVAPSDPPLSADALGWLRAVAAFESTGDVDTAAEGYQAGVKRWPEEPLAWAALGNARYLQQRPEAAETAYRRALELAPGLWVVRNNLVQTLVSRGCPELAEPWITAAGTPPDEIAPIWNATLADVAAAAGADPAADRCAAASSL